MKTLCCFSELGRTLSKALVHRDVQPRYVCEQSQPEAVLS